MNFFIENKYIDCSYNQCSCFDDAVVQKITALFDSYPKNNIIPLQDIYKKLSWKLNSDVKLKTFFQIYHCVKYAVVQYYKTQANAAKKDMIVFFYYDVNLEPCIKKIDFVPNLYENDPQRYADYDYNELNKRVVHAIKQHGKRTHTIPLFTLKLAVQIINTYKNMNAQISIKRNAEHIDYEEYLFILSDYFYKLLDKGIAGAIGIEWSAKNTDTVIITLRQRAGNPNYLVIPQSLRSNVRDKEISAHYFVEFIYSEHYKHLIDCSSFSANDSFSTPLLDEKHKFMEVQKCIRNGLNELPLHQPISFFDFFEHINVSVENVGECFECLHILKNEICKKNNGGAITPIVLRYAENKTLVLEKLDTSTRAMQFEKSVDANRLEDTITEAISEAQSKISITIDLENLAQWEHIATELGLENCGISDYWECANSIVELADRKSDAFSATVTPDQDNSKIVHIAFIKKEKIISGEVTIKITPLQKELCIWLFYKGFASCKQIQTAYLKLISTESSENFFDVFYPLYNKGIVEVCWNGTDTAQYYCTADKDFIDDSTKTEFVKTVSHKESDIICALKAMPSLSDVLKKQGTKEAEHMQFSNFKKNKFIYSNGQALGLIKQSEIYAPCYFSFGDEVYRLPDKKESPEISKIAKCAQRNQDNEKLFQVIDTMVVCKHIRAVPTPIARLLFMLDPKVLEQDAKAVELCFHNISKSAIEQLKRIFGEGVFA